MRPSDRDVTLFARTNYREEYRTFGIRRADRRSHMYVVGQTGTGKSTLFETLIRTDMEAGEGLALLDPHGDLLERVRMAVPAHRRSDIIDFNVPDPNCKLGFNPLDRVQSQVRPLAASGLVDAFKKIWADSWGPRMEHILRNAIYTLLEQPQATLGDILRLFDDYAFRRQALASVTNRQVHDFWVREFAGYPDRLRAEAIAPIQNKVGAFLADPTLQRILNVPRSSFDLREAMDQGRILLVNLAKGRLGSDSASLLGALLVARIGLAGLSRADTTETSRRDFWVYLDEFQSFATLSVAGMLSELRKYHVGLVLGHQYLGQLDLPLRDAILGNAGTKIMFRLGVTDAELLAPELAPTFAERDLVNLPNHHVYLRLMIDGLVSRPFSAETFPPDSKDAQR